MRTFGLPPKPKLRWSSVERLSFNRPAGTQRLPVTGAAAHMSLHLNQQCQRADASPSPFYRGTGLPIDEARTSQTRGPCLVGEQPYMEENSVRQQLFSKFSCEAFEASEAGVMPCLRSLKPYGERRTVRQGLHFKSFFRKLPANPAPGEPQRRVGGRPYGWVEPIRQWPF